MRFLVTGGTGFVGSHMVELLLSRGWEVVCPVRDRLKPKYLEGRPATIVPLADLSRHLRDHPRFDYVIHVAGATRGLHYEDYRVGNVEFTRDLLGLFSAPAHAANLKRFVCVSSQAACGPAVHEGEPVHESDLPQPVSLYGRSKREAEEVVLGFRDRLPITIVRPPTVFGPRDLDVLGLFQCARYRIVPYIFGADRKVSIIYVEDLVEGILAAALASAAVGEIYFLSNAEPVIWREFSLLVAELMGCRAIAVPVPLWIMKAVGIGGDVAGKIRGSASLFRSEKVEEMQQLAWICSSEKAYRHLGWRPRVPLREAVRRTEEWYREHGWI